MRIFLLARHGESLFNVAGVVNADPSLDRGLSEAGREEARGLAAQLTGLEVELLATSRFPRAQETGTIALEAHPAPHVVLPDLDDVNIGDLEGKTVADYRARKRGRPRGEPFPGGESLDHAAARYAAAYRSLLGRPESTILVVCHEIPVRYALNAASGSSDLDAPYHDIGNAVPYVFDERGLENAAAGIERLSLSAAR